MRATAIGLVLLVCSAIALASTQYTEPNSSFFEPLVTRHPIIERALEFGLTHEKGLDARETAATLTLEVPILPRLQFEVEVPLRFRNPDEGMTVAGFSDLEVEAKLQVFKSVQYRTLVAFLRPHSPPARGRVI
jgi:hypothetical protein